MKPSSSKIYEVLQFLQWKQEPEWKRCFVTFEELDPLEGKETEVWVKKRFFFSSYLRNPNLQKEKETKGIDQKNDQTLQDLADK